MGMSKYDVNIGIAGAEDVEAMLNYFDGEIDEVEAAIDAVSVKRRDEEGKNLTFRQRHEMLLHERRQERTGEENMVLDFSRKATRVFKTVEREREQLERNTISTVRRSMQLIGRTYSVIQSTMRLFGVQMPAMLGATIQLIVTLAGTFIKLATAKLAAQDYVGAALTFTAAGLTFAHQVVAEVQRQQIEQDVQSIISLGDATSMRFSNIAVRI